jgi:hypothetical protein
MSRMTTPSPATTSEIVDFLNELLEAERAGTRVALDSARGAGAERYADLLEHIRHDEARWCAMLLRQIARLGGQASPRMGAFHGKAMAVEGLEARLAFLNRGQGWVVRKLNEMIPRLQDEALRADLDEMLGAHVANIAATNAAIT